MPLTSRGDVFVVPTPGHTPGHVSVVVEGEVSVFIAGDTSYTEDLLRAGVVDGVSPDENVWVKWALDQVFADAHRHERGVVTQDAALDCRRIRLYG